MLKRKKDFLSFMEKDLKNKLVNLRRIIKDMGSVLIAYSGGVDSTFLLKVALDCLEKNKVLAVTADSETYPRDELRFAKSMAAKLGVRHKIIHTQELRNPKFVQNPIDRCYYCKLELFSKLKEIAKREKINFVLDASQESDNADFRPGEMAKWELGVRSPLKETKFTKEDIRRLSKLLGLITWDMPAQACLASRFAYGNRITKYELRRVEAAEKVIKDLGFKLVRVRSYDTTCRIEVERKEINKLINSLKDDSINRIKKLGYKYITVDLEGYRAGSMNLTLLKSND